MLRPLQCDLWDDPAAATRKERWEVMRELRHDRDHSRSLLRCRLCGQLYLHERYEEKDWDSGDDSVYETLIPVRGDEDADEIMADAPGPMHLLAYFPRLMLDWPRGAREQRIRWVGRDTPGRVA
ncbi:hypothetical protein HKCCE2091_14880 [Rhodobacterales bacterium HKCCE2091]|nr:hypothetical protein [Rhodobacterales bacterium HKCCE2091]